jgi:lysophospholipase L1-like esterase
MIRLVLFLFATLTVSSWADDSNVLLPPPQPPAGTPTAAFPAPRLDQLHQFLDHVKMARSAPVDIIFDGDSITDFWQGTGQAIFNDRYRPLNTVDFAISGDRTQHVLWRVNHGELDGLHPKLIMLMIGTNNLGNASPEEIEAGIKAIVDKYRSACPDAHILLLGIFPRGNLATDGARPLIKQINDVISKYDDGDHVIYRDIGGKFLQPDGTLTAEIMPDFLHPSAKGYQIWADAIQDVVDKYCPKTSATPSPAGAPAPNITSKEPSLSWPFPMTPPAGQPTATFPIPRDDWIYRFAGNLDKLKQGPYDIVFDGDSITDNWQGPGADVMKQRYPNIKILDVAIGGDQVQHVLWRIQHGSVDGQNPKLVMLMIGTNNGGQDPKDIAAGIKLIIGEYEKRCPNAQILLLGVFPRDHDANTGTRNWVKAINAIISGYSSDPKVTYMDIGDKFLTPDGVLAPEIMPDFLHPSPKGYTIWADAIQPVVDKYFPAAKK